MKRLALSLLCLVLVFVSVPLWHAQIRHLLYNGILDFPEFAYGQLIKGSLITRKYEVVESHLNTYGKLVDFFGRENNRLVPGFIETIKSAYETTLLNAERQHLMGSLRLADSLSPGNIDVNLMIAEIMALKDPIEAFDRLVLVNKSVGSDFRIVPIANLAQRNLAWQNIDVNCEHVEPQSFGDYEGLKSTSLLGGGLRRIAFGYNAPSGDQVFLNEGLELNTLKEYRFSTLGETLNPTSAFFIFSTGGNVKISLYSMAIHTTDGNVKTYEWEQLQATPESGMLFDGSILSQNHNGEKVYINPQILDGLDVSQIVLSAQFARVQPNILSCVKK
ncbi:MAG: hypothetical protein ACON4I_04630 [Candidatus Puniceispirillaceae bacterium]